jgi:hypothetical protein
VPQLGVPQLGAVLLKKNVLEVNVIRRWGTLGMRTRGPKSSQYQITVLKSLCGSGLVA